MAFLDKIETLCWLERNDMIDRPAQAAAAFYSQAGRSIRWPASAKPDGWLANQLGPGIFQPGSTAISADVPQNMAFTNHLCLDENLLWQSASI